MGRKKIANQVFRIAAGGDRFVFIELFAGASDQRFTVHGDPHWLGLGARPCSGKCKVRSKKNIIPYGILEGRLKDKSRREPEN